ncbi:MAG TPA: ABC transporter permease, partial [Acidimicrobiales bacterium]|nr:ABC transporter permease [Acidimicrobiales bacterium]
MPAAAFVLVVSLPFLWLLARRPVLRRLAVRNASRRPRETALILLGSLLGTAIITGSLVVGDTLAASFRWAAYSHQGPVDELVETPGVGSNGPVLAALQQRLASSPDIDGLLPLTTAPAAVATVGTSPKAEPRSQLVEVDFDAARSFGGDASATGISGSTPGAGRGVIGADLARTLGVRAGDPVTAYAYGRTVTVTVDRVLPRLGIAGLSLGLGSRAPNLFVAPGTIAGLAQGAAAGASPPLSAVAVSNRGGVLAGGRLWDRVSGQIRSALGPLQANVNPIKNDTLDAASAQGKQFTQLFSGIGFFSVLAGVLLLVNIFVMLAQERKTELGMLRSVGLRRAGLVGGFSLEGWLYALASSGLGAVAGLGVGRLIVVAAARIFSRPGDIMSLELRYTARGASLLGGFAFGFAISLLTVVITSLSISRLNVIRAIRDLPDPPTTRRQQLRTLVVGAVVFVVGSFLFASGVAGQAPVALLAGPALMGTGGAPLVSRWLPRRAVVSVIAGALLVYETASVNLFHKAFDSAQIPVYVVLGVILTGAGVALVSQNQDAIGHVVRRAGGGSKSMALRLGLAYPLAKRFRTGMILTMYALVVFTLVLITVFAHLFSRQLDDFTAKVSGGFDVRVDANASNPIPAGAVRRLPGVAAVSVISNAGAQFAETCPVCANGFRAWPASTFDESLVAAGPPALTHRLPQYASDAAAYRALLAEPDAFIPSRFFLQTGGGPPAHLVTVGDRVIIKDPVSGQTRDLRVIATAEAGFGNAMALISPQAMQELFPGRSSPNSLFVAAERGVDRSALAARINGTFLANGADAKAFRTIVDENLGQQRQFFRLMQGYLALGLVVGIAGLGVVMVRAVRERRRQVGVLRALGFPAAAVRRAFIA